MKHSLEELCNLYNSGLSAGKIAKKLGDIHSRTVSYHLRCAAKEKLISLRSRSDAALLTNNRKHNIDHNFFDIIDNEYKSYILGFLYADGYNNEKRGRIEINLIKTDEQILLEMSKAMKSDYPLLYLPARGQSNEKACLRFQSREISQKLAHLGCYQGKSLTCDMPSFEIVPEHLFHHFLRGYFDGDGCVYYSKTNNDVSLGFCGSKKFISKLCLFLNEKFGSNVNPTPNNNIFTVSYNGINKAKLLHEYLYKDATIFLNRKYIRYEECLKLYEKNSVHYPHVAKCDIEGNVISIYENTLDACRNNPGTNPGNLWRAAKGIYSSHKGFKWKFVE